MTEMTRAEAERVKVSHFTKQGFELTGVVHVGANDGYEIDFYFALGAKKVIAVEPLMSARKKLSDLYGGDPRVEIIPLALGEKNEWGVLNVAHGDGKGSTFLREFDPYEITGIEFSGILRFDSIDVDLAGFDTLVVDVQGMELQVLKGFGDTLNAFSFLNIECSRVPLFEGEAPASEIIAFLSSMGFDQDSPIEDHDDIMFIRKGLKSWKWSTE